jgi:hypothetical protein
MIDGIIPSRNFELVRDQIGLVLLQELSNQKILQSLDENILIYSERTSPINSNELLTINIGLDSGDYSSKDQSSSAGKIIYNIDVYTVGFADSEKDGSKDSAFRLHKYIGMIHYILNHAMYKTLDLPLGIIAGTSVDNFSIMDSDLKQDSSHVKMGRISFSVRMIENQTLEYGVDLLSNETKVKLDLTDLGYIYKLIN